MLEVTLVVARGCDRAFGNVHRRDDGGLGLARMADPDVPGRAVRLATDRTHVAAKIDQRMRDAALLQDRRRAIRRVFLADAAEVELHAGLREPHETIAPLHVLPAE